jgi:hypothetical protein
MNSDNDHPENCENNGNCLACLFKQSTEDFNTADDQISAASVIRSSLLKLNHANGLRV